LPPLLQLLGDLELFLCGACMRDLLVARGLPVCLPEWLQESDSASQITDLYNPLLLALDVTPVTCSLSLGPLAVATLLTGPNSGGKTRLLQAVGILQLLAQAGMYVPASAARLARVPGIFASLSQPASAEQVEGRLGTELLRIRMLFERAGPGYLVLIDELCSGTSPSEGEELFRLVLELLEELSPVALVSTHFLKFAAELARDPSLPKLKFLQVELDQSERPTYRFVPGVASTSLARQTAARLGVTREELRALMQRRR
jgi:DNA mismatch repair protein MutS2